MICQQIEGLIDYAIKKNIITVEDRIFVRNRLMNALGVSEWTECSVDCGDMTVDELLLPLIDYAVKQGIIQDTQNNRDLFDTRLMGLIMPMPREVIRNFDERYAISPDFATEWYYRFSRDVNYVRAERIKKDLKWKYPSEYGELDITVNLSKPEKDPRDIAAAGSAKASGYPKCQLCIENSGFAGHQTHPARQNLIPIPMTVGGEDWSLQYSPYGYYNEHCIVFNNCHTPMKIDRAVFKKLFDVIDFLPHYFVGSNADLPIVGGSILSHEHFQGGKYSFAMERAEIEWSFDMSDFPEVKAGIVKWPMSVVRISSKDKEQLVAACDRVLSAWRGYTDPEVFIFAETDGVPHNTVTPIARKQGDSFVCDLVLRNNITTSERPLGLYHPAPELHHIKKENIGLIEVMGLAVLPSRLSREIDIMCDAINSDKNPHNVPEILHHAEWLDSLTARHGGLKGENVRQIIEEGIGEVFLNVLLDAGVFKRDANGQAAFRRFVDIIK